MHILLWEACVLLPFDRHSLIEQGADWMPFLHAYRRCFFVLANTHVWSTLACVLVLRGSQVLCLAEQVYFTRQAEEILKGDHVAAPGSLRALRERLMGQLTAYTAHDLSSEPLLQVGVNAQPCDRRLWSMLWCHCVVRAW